LLVNSGDEPKTVREKLEFKGKIATVDATKISLETLGMPMPNTPMLGALVKVRPVVSIDSLIEQIKHKFLKKIGEEKTKANIDGIRRAYEETKIG
jgi:pyruvate ferredoxin oxidoreductase gamma subunit